MVQSEMQAAVGRLVQKKMDEDHREELAVEGAVSGERI